MADCENQLRWCEGGHGSQRLSHFNNSKSTVMPCFTTLSCLMLRLHISGAIYFYFWPAVMECFRGYLGFSTRLGKTCWCPRLVDVKNVRPQEPRLVEAWKIHQSVAPKNFRCASSVLRWKSLLEFANIAKSFHFFVKLGVVPSQPVRDELQ